MQKLKDLLENICEWPAKRENHECFLPHELSIIQYLPFINYPSTECSKIVTPLQRFKELDVELVSYPLNQKSDYIKALL